MLDDTMDRIWTTVRSNSCSFITANFDEPMTCTGGRLAAFARMDDQFSVRRYPTEMKHLLVVTALVSTLGCSEPRKMTASQSQADENVQLFNESVLGSAPTDAIPMLLPNATATWAPKQVVLDYNDNACYGAMIHYERSHPFESLRRAINSRFGDYEQPTFANDRTMGIWRMEDAGFTIQLSDSEDEDSYMAIYIRFVDPAIMADKIDDLRESEPELFDDFLVEEFTEALRDMESEASQNPDGG